ncbi:hypothetical protein MHZ92_18460 [Sporosarcina sp. ACRSL]|uniref:hypothetical protein n=1 Tax=Sporosarcina sp. ACRSL TaxID=2918215 RepID=UPI001EF50295|nr:hypothetical protein [Sporosarcina sp. ACRSL]MCG7346097.1 hypothetical protein [Sporosarcina sp. ACRSL]
MGEKSDKRDLFPHILPNGDEIRVWDFAEIQKFTGPGVYVFWGRNVALKDNFKDRHSYEYQDLPLYIGRADNLAERVINHIKGKTHTKPICVYFHTVDIFDLSDFEKLQYQGMDELMEFAEFQKIMTDNELTSKAMSDFYELYFIMRKLPIFNDRSNHFTTKALIDGFFKTNFHNTLHRREWAKNEVEEKFSYNYQLQERNDYKINAKEEFDKQNIKLEYWYAENDFIKKVILRWHLRVKSDKGKELKRLIKNQISNKLLTGLEIDYSEKPIKVPCESIIFYEQIFSKDNFRKYYESLGKTW